MSSKSKRGGRPMGSYEFDENVKKNHKPKRKNKEERIMESQVELMETPTDQSELMRLIKEGNEFYGDCGCGIPLTIHHGITKDVEPDYSFSCLKCGERWTMKDLLA